MAYCSKCGTELVTGADFCSGCGVRLGEVLSSPNQTSISASITIPKTGFFKSHPKRTALIVIAVLVIGAGYLIQVPASLTIKNCVDLVPQVLKIAKESKSLVTVIDIADPKTIPLPFDQIKAGWKNLQSCQGNAVWSSGSPGLVNFQLAVVNGNTFVAYQPAATP
jgi:uncharacterized OB-fold protein